MLFKTRSPQYNKERKTEFINKPLYNGISFPPLQELSKPSEPVGVIRGTELIDDEIEFTVELFDEQLIKDITKNQQVSFSIKGVKQGG